MKKNINIENIGPVLFQKSKRAKKINISIKSNKTVRVAVPLYLTYQYAEEIVYSKIEWIQNNLEKISKKINLQRNNVPMNKEDSKKLLIDRTNYLAKQNNFPINRVFIKNQKTRWGSCSSKNNINLNIQLCRLPDELIDYVIFHELVHSYIKNHSVVFWNMLIEYVPNARQLDEKLKEFMILY